MQISPQNYDALSITEATSEQKRLRSLLQFQPLGKEVKTIGGCDISLNRFSETIYAGIVVLDYFTLEPLSYALVKSKTRFPYVPGFLAFREVPALIEALALIPEKPDILMVDGHGIAHPRRMGIASHLGALTSVPTLGCAKKKLYGRFAEPELSKGAYSPLADREETIGYVLRSKDKVHPVFISPGNRLDLEGSLRVAMHCVKKHRLPEPTRRAHEFVNRFRIGELKPGYHVFSQNPELF